MGAYHSDPCYYRYAVVMDGWMGGTLGLGVATRDEERERKVLCVMGEALDYVVTAL